METTNALTTTPTIARTWLRPWRWLAIAGVLIGAGTALALSQQWLAVATLVPLLYVLPCAAMMFMCMRGMNHGRPTGTATAAGNETPTGLNTTK
jgi:threonine/homoserine/homoserine lactone efflux protein